MKLEKYKISIIVPVYNVEPFLRKCIYSLLNQTYKNIEIILVDDESPDNCGKICDAFAKEDSRVKVIHQQNQGVCAARNAALKVATGDYYGFVDPDDWVTPDMYEYLLSNLLEHDADISCCRYYRVVPGEKTYSATDGECYVYNKAEAIKELVCNFTIRAIFWNKLFKKELFDGIVFPEGTIYEGTFLVHKIFEKAEKILFLPDAKYFYYKFEKSYVNTVSVKHQCDFVLANIEQYKDLHEKYPELTTKILKKILARCIELEEICYKNQDDIEKNMQYIEQISVFVKDHLEEITGLKNVNFITRKKIAYYENPSMSVLKAAHFWRVVGKKGKKLKKNLKKVLKYLKKKVKKVKNIFIKKEKKQKTKKYGVSMEYLTQEDKAIFDKLHKCEIEILDEFVRVCDLYNLRYFLYGGTLLGAVRHKGFIPWDDDIDIVMPREDYEKLAEICQKDLKEGFFYQTNKTDEQFPMLFAKIRMDNTYVREEKWDDLELHKGIYIDILPLDLFPEVKGIKSKLLLEKFNILNSACQNNRCLSKHFISKIIFKYYKLLPASVRQEKREKYIKNLCKDDQTSLVCSFGSHYRPIIKRVLMKEWFEDYGEKMEFEGKMYSVPKGWNEYLVHLYGEKYMELPPVDKRINHFSFYEIKFADEE